MTHNNMFGSQYSYSAGTQLYQTACDDKQCDLLQSLVKCHVKRHCTEKYKLNPLAILNKAIYFNQLTTISYRFHLISNNNKTDMHSKLIPPFFSKVINKTHSQLSVVGIYYSHHQMKDIWCTFKAGSLNREKKLSAKIVLKIK